MEIKEYIDRIEYVDIVEEDIEEIQHRIERLEGAFNEYLEAIEYIQNWIYSDYEYEKEKYNIKNRKNQYIPIEESKNFYIYMDKKEKRYIAIKK